MRRLLPLTLLFAFLSACDADSASPDVGSPDTTSEADTPTDTSADTALPPDGDSTSADTAVSPDASDTTTPPTCDLTPGDPGFDDHTVTAFMHRSCFVEYSDANQADPAAIKFTIVDLNHPADPASLAVRFYDNAFYSLHDEWYWFRLLNGHPIPGLTTPAPLTGLSFPTIASIYLAYAGQTTLPLDLQFLPAGTGFGGRLYSPNFYSNLAKFNAPLAERFLALGTVIFYPANPNRVTPEAFWAFEFEFTDAPTRPYLERVAAALEAKLPPEVRGKLRWLARSSVQVALARTLAAEHVPLGVNALTYDDVVVRGETEVYNEGIAAGRVHLLTPGFGPSDVAPDEIIILPEVPDDIPISRAIISSVPQMPLAHVNLLAKSRGTPNAHVAGISSWGTLNEWAWARTPVIVEVLADAVRWKPMTAANYQRYLTLATPPARSIPVYPHPETAPLTFSLTEGDVTTMASHVPLIGGKSSGIISFNDHPGMATPFAPLALTVRAYREHVAPLLPTLQAALADPLFSSDSRARFLTLEGEPAFWLQNPRTPVNEAFVAALHRDHTTDALGTLIAAGGVRQLIQDTPLRYETLRDLRAALEARFADLAPTQGLRFRSSSTAEDVPGFNGAGLYLSNTGFLYPSQLSDPGDRRKTIEVAIKATWASYWSFQGFEERRAQGLDHFAGAMGVLVHPRFDDAFEKANIVITFYISTYQDPPTFKLHLNAQYGSRSVTNPGGSLDRPEVDEVTQVGDGAPSPAHLQASTLVPAGTRLVSDATLLSLFHEARAHALAWLGSLDPTQPPAERPQTLVLDYELKDMAAGWPALASGAITPARIIWRQSRVLDQPARLTAATPDPFDAGAGALPLTQGLPRDLRTVVKALDVDRCDSEWADLRIYRVFTESTQSDLFPFVSTPFIYRVQVHFKKAPVGFSPSLARGNFSWTQLTERHFSTSTGSRVVFSPSIQAALGGIEGMEIGTMRDPIFRVWGGQTSFTSTCTRQTLRPFQSASDFLRGLMNATP